MQVLRERRAAEIGPLAAVAELLEDVATHSSPSEQISCTCLDVVRRDVPSGPLSVRELSRKSVRGIVDQSSRKNKSRKIRSGRSTDGAEGATDVVHEISAAGVVELTQRLDGIQRLRGGRNPRMEIL